MVKKLVKLPKNKVSSPWIIRYTKEYWLPKGKNNELVKKLPRQTASNNIQTDSWIIRGLRRVRINIVYFDSSNMFSSGLFWLYKKKNGYHGIALEYGIRNSNTIQFLPIYYKQNNSVVSIGLGLYKAYFGISLFYNRDPSFSKIYYYGDQLLPTSWLNKLKSLF